MVPWRVLLAAYNPKARVRFQKSITFQVHYFENNLLVQRKSNMANEPLTFNSRSKEPNDKFSNFYEAEINMPEGVFGSVEHYFQAMKFVDKDHARFEVNGDLGKQRFQKGTWKDAVSRGRFIKSAGGKSGTKKYGLTLRSDGLDRDRAKQNMTEGLRKKFEAEPFRSLLINTGSLDLIHTPMRGKSDYWTGRVDKTSGNITGENNMGRLLMKVREELQKVGKISVIEENDNGLENISSEENMVHEESKIVKSSQENESEKINDDEKNVDDEQGIDDKEGDDENNGGGEEKSDDKDRIKKTKDISKSECKRKRDDEQVNDDKSEGSEVKRKKTGK